MLACDYVIKARDNVNTVINIKCKIRFNFFSAALFEFVLRVTTLSVYGLFTGNNKKSNANFATKIRKGSHTHKLFFLLVRILYFLG